MRRDRLQTQTDETVGINLSPMIDCIFILLIFFVVTTVFVETPQVQIIEPAALSDEALQDSSIIVGITERDEIVYAGRAVELAGLRLRLRQLLQDRDYPVVIQADRNCSHAAFSRVWTTAEDAGAKRIRVATKDEAE
ncbi:MAG: biopolymer transport protein ExbD [Puniceicoccaceae bacterium 5H]|nr:MAG: biopolymer transport protein ExbD [Puniceicoccaceae bacterium 5H]